jgi:DNA-binding response OmpR family regulator
MFAASQFDLAVVDWYLPDRSGPDLCQEFRAGSPSCLIMVISGNDPPDDTERSVWAGADDFVAKPFRIGQLKALIHARLRRPQSPVAETIRVGAMVVDCARHTVRCDGKLVPLTPREYQLLLMLARNGSRLVGRAELIARVWDDNHDSDFRSVDVLMARVRKKLREAGGPIIATRRGFGYSLGADPIVGSAESVVGPQRGSPSPGTAVRAAWRSGRRRGG